MKALFSSLIIILLFQTSITQANMCEKEVYSKTLLSLTDKVLNSVLNRDENAYENPLGLVEYQAPMYCGVHTYSGTKYTLVSVKVTVDEFSTEGAESYRMKDTCFISFTFNDQWVAEHISCDEQLSIEEELSITL